MRFSSFAVLSGLAAIATVNAFPVRGWKPKDNVTTTSAPSSTPPPVICCVVPGVPTLCTECHSYGSYGVTPSAHPPAPQHHTASADPCAPTHHHEHHHEHHHHHHHHHNGTDSTYPPAPTYHHNATTSATPSVPTHPHHNLTTSVPPAAPSDPNNVTLSARMDKSAYQLAQSDPSQFLSEYVFQNLLIDEFKFGKGTSGKVGSSTNVISQYVVLSASTEAGSLKPATANRLAIHLNTMVTASKLQNNVITIQGAQFHLTARSITTQKKIDASGPSIATAAQSIHIGVNTPWGRAANLKALAEEVGISTDQTLHDLDKKQGYNNPYVVLLVKEFRTKVQQRIQQLLGGHVSVKWQGDKSFPTQ